MAALERTPAWISRDALNLLGIEGTFTADFETGALIEVGRAFTNLIDGRIISGAAAGLPMPGSQHG